MLTLFPPKVFTEILYQLDVDRVKQWEKERAIAKIQKCDSPVIQRECIIL